MGFFSAIKKLWKGNSGQDEAAPVVDSRVESGLAGNAPLPADAASTPQVPASTASPDATIPDALSAVTSGVSSGDSADAASGKTGEGRDGASASAVSAPAVATGPAGGSAPSAASGAASASGAAPATGVAVVPSAPEVAIPSASGTIPASAGAPAAGTAGSTASASAAPARDSGAGASLPPLSDDAAWKRDLTLALRQAEPRLSIWLGHVLEGVDEADDTLWERLAFFFRALEVPPSESEAFINEFRRWLTAMEYQYVPEFRSELQYRLALALDLEDEEDERSRLMLKLSEGLARTREQIGRRIDGLLASHSRIDEAFWEELEEILIMADVGFEPAMELVQRLRKRAREAGTDDPERFRELLREELEVIFRAPRRIAAVNPPEVVLMIGVNGVGKTTTIAKLAYRARMQGKKVLIAAADTFRAAASEQLQIWAERVGAGFHAKGAGADPAAVAYEAMDRAVNEGYDILFVDTAGRLHTKVNLMEELHKIRKVLGKKHPGAPHRSILVIDATTGQNALSQTKLFNEACGVDEIVLTKLDGTAKGGIVVAVAMQFGIPITYVGLGEKMEDLRPFNGSDFAMALLGAGEGTLPQA